MSVAGALALSPSAGLSRLPRPALWDAWPALEERIPWVPLGWFPTAVERVDGLLPPTVELWVKREDQSGLAYGGNKVRKLEFVLADALGKNATRLVTVGGWGSHHVLATAVYGRQLGFELDAVVFPQPLSQHVCEQILADAGAGARLHPTRGYAGVPLAIWRLRRGAVYIPGGGSSPTGTLGYVSCGVEIAAQMRDQALPPIDAVYCALGSGGMSAGLLLGLAGSSVSELVAVRVVDWIVARASVVRSLARRTAKLLDGKVQRQPKLRVDHSQFGGAYGRSTQAALEAVAAAAAVGLELEPTYTGKAMAALLSDARSGRLDGKRVLFIQSFSSTDLGPLLAAAPPPASLPPRLRRAVESLL
jgi:1-aminocyclopropane-1-carboxylate deaminase/D-cysteine desulfhydrase-like pyridoxal-dependent ACC family enzyme